MISIQLVMDVLKKAASNGVLNVANSGLISSLVPAIRNLIKLGILGVSATASVFALYKLFRYLLDKVAWPRNALSRLMAATAVTPALRPETLRTQYMDMPLDRVKIQPGHSHAQSAATRTTASHLADRYARIIGRTPYFYQRSRADERHDRPGSRSYYWSRDMDSAPEDYDPPPNPLIVLIDVDYYVDMPVFLANNYHPVLIYTLQPEVAARDGLDYTYTFNEDNHIIYTVRGGDVFTHKVWNYTPDHLRVSRSIFGIPISSSTFIVDRKTLGPDRQLVLCAPLCKHRFPFSLIASWVLDAKALLRITPVVKGFIRLDSSGPLGSLRSTARCGDLACATIPTVIDNAIATIARTSSLTLTMPQVWSMISEDGNKESTRVPAAILMEFHRLLVESKPPMVCPPKVAIQKYQFDPFSYDPTARPAMIPFMDPLLNGTYVPDKTAANDRQGVKSRLTDIKTTVEMTPFLSQVMTEYLELLIPEPNLMHPVDEDELYLRQPRPTQRHILEQAAYMPKGRRALGVFNKSESYGEVKPPRLISTINGVDKGSYSKYTYPIAAMLKSQPWYAFGKVPREIADRVVEICASAQIVVNTDLSKFDGRVSGVLRELEMLTLLRAYSHEHHQEVLDLHRSQFNLPATTTFGTVYNSGTARASGSPETAAFNSIANSFMAFLAFRRLRVNGAFLNPKEAWARLGIYGGDDGLTADMDVSVYVSSCGLVGQVLAALPLTRGSHGIKFLAREYSPEVWFGNPSSMCDLPRQLVKFHTTVVLPESILPQAKLIEKGRAFALTDLNTPIMGPLVRKIVKIAGLQPDAPTALPEAAVWESNIPTIDQYPNEPGEWMIATVQRLLPSFDHKTFQTWLTKCNTLDDLLHPYICAPLEEPVNNTGQMVVVNEELVPPVKPAQPRQKTPPPSDKSRKESKTKPKNIRLGAASKKAPKPSGPASERKRG